MFTSVITKKSEKKTKVINFLNDFRNIEVTN